MIGDRIPANAGLTYKNSKKAAYISILSILVILYLLSILYIMFIL